MKFSTSRLVGAALTIALVWFLALPLGDVLRYPDRVSVLGNLQADAATYDGIAQEVAATWSLSAYPVRHPPGWPTVLAVIYTVGGHSLVLGKLISWLALVGSVVLCAWLARRVHGPSAAWIAALLCASSPGLRAYVGTLQYEVLTGFLALSLLAAALHTSSAAIGRRIAVRAVAAGVIGAVLVLTREPFALVVLLTALWVAHRLRRVTGPRHAALAATLLTVIAAAPAVSWSIAQSLRAGRLITISEKGPMVVEFGNNPLANGTYNAPLVGVAEPTGLRFVQAFPMRALVLACRKVLYFWGVLRDGWNVPHAAILWVWKATSGAVPWDVIAPLVRGGWLLVLFVVGLWWLGKAGLRNWWIVPGTVCVILAIHVATVSSYRFAVSVLPIVYVVASGPLARAAEIVGGFLRAPLVAGAGALLLALAVALQFQHPRFDLVYHAVDLDGAQADNELDAVSGRPARVADARRGPRVVAMLADESLPGGEVMLTVRARRRTESAETRRVAAQASLTELSGRTACRLDITVEQLPLERFVDVPVSCWLSTTGPTTVAIATLGVVDLTLDQVRLNWTGAP